MGREPETRRADLAPGLRRIGKGPRRGVSLTKLKVPQKQPKKGRLWLGDGSCIRLRPERPNHVWSYDFVEGRTHGGRKIRMLNVIDQFSRECLAIRIDRKLNSTAVIDMPRPTCSFFKACLLTFAQTTS